MLLVWVELHLSAAHHLVPALGKVAGVARQRLLVLPQRTVLHGLRDHRWVRLLLHRGLHGDQSGRHFLVSELRGRGL